MVIGVLAILLGIAILVFHLVNNGNLSTKTQQEIFILKGVADTLTESAANYGYLGTADVAKSGMVPSRYINGESIISPYGSNWKVVYGTYH